VTRPSACPFVLRGGPDRGRPCGRPATKQTVAGPRCGLHTASHLTAATGRSHCHCGKVITEYHWRDPSRCLPCYLELKRGAVIVCTSGDVRMLDNVPGNYALRKFEPQVLFKEPIYDAKMQEIDVPNDGGSSGVG